MFFLGLTELLAPPDQKQRRPQAIEAGLAELRRQSEQTRQLADQLTRTVKELRDIMDKEDGKD